MIARLLILVLGTAGAYPLLLGLPQGWPALVRVGLATMLLLPALAYWLRPGPPGLARARSRRPAAWLDRMLLGMVPAAGACAFMWLLSAAPEPLESLSLALEERARPAAAATRREHRRQGHQQAPGGNWLWNDEGRRALPVRTSFKPGNRPELFIRLRERSDATELLQGQIYARAFTLSRYQNAAWSPHPGTPQRIPADATGLVRLATPTRRVIVHEVYHPYDPNGQNPLIALQGVVTAQVPELTRLDEGLLLLPPAEQPSGYEYLAGSAPLRLEDLPETAEISPADLADPVFTAGLPPSPFATRVGELAATASGAGTTRQRLLKLRNHLRATLGYSLETANPHNLDPMDNFLFTEKRGHCEYFATAGALLARSLGVPSRVAYGWTGGTYYESSNMFVFRAREAHAWTEVCLAGHGWVVLDPTPPAGAGNSRTAVAPPDEAPPAPQTPEDLAETIAPLEPGRIARWLTLGLALPALVLLIGRGLGRRRAAQGAPDAPPPAAGTPHYLSLWRRASARRGMPMPTGMTLRQHLARLPQPARFAADLLAYHYAVRYSGSPPDPHREKSLAAAIRKWGDERETPSA